MTPAMAAGPLADTIAEAPIYAPKRPARRCTKDNCAHLTRHRTQRCPDHRTH